MFNLLSAVTNVFTSSDSATTPQSTNDLSKNGIIAVENESDIVKVSYCEIGSTILLRSLDGEMFDVFVLSADINDKKVLIKHKIILVLLAHQIAEIARIPNKVGYGKVENVYEMQALQRLRYRANPNPGPPPSSTITASDILASFTFSGPTPLPAPSNSGLLVLELKSGKLLKYYSNNPMPCVESIKRKMKELGLESHSKRHLPEDTALPSSSSSSSSSFISVNHNSNTIPVLSTTTTTESTSPLNNSQNNPQQSSPSKVKTKQAREEDLMAVANYYLEESKKIEQEFSIHPSVDLIEEMMNLFRLAVEHFANVPNNMNYEKIVYSIQSFLIRDDVVQVLEAKRLRDLTDPHKQSSGKKIPPHTPPSSSSSSTVSPAPATPITNNNPTIAKTPKSVRINPQVSIAPSPSVNTSARATNTISSYSIADISQEILYSPKSILMDDSDWERSFHQQHATPLDSAKRKEMSSFLLLGEESETYRPVIYEIEEDEDLDESKVVRRSRLDGGQEGEGEEEGGDGQPATELSQFLQKIDQEFYDMLKSFTPAKEISAQLGRPIELAGPSEEEEDDISRISIDKEIEKLLRL